MGSLLTSPREIPISSWALAWSRRRNSCPRGVRSSMRGWGGRQSNAQGYGSFDERDSWSGRGSGPSDDDADIDEGGFEERGRELRPQSSAWRGRSAQRASRRRSVRRGRGGPDRASAGRVRQCVTSAASVIVVVFAIGFVVRWAWSASQGAWFKNTVHDVVQATARMFSGSGGTVLAASLAGVCCFAVVACAAARYGCAVRCGGGYGRSGSLSTDPAASPPPAAHSHLARGGGARRRNAEGEAAAQRGSTPAAGAGDAGSDSGSEYYGSGARVHPEPLWFAGPNEGNLFSTGASLDRDCTAAVHSGNRAQVWSMRLGNALLVTPELFKICRQLAERAISGQPRYRHGRRAGWSRGRASRAGRAAARGASSSKGGAASEATDHGGVEAGASAELDEDDDKGSSKLEGLSTTSGSGGDGKDSGERVGGSDGEEGSSDAGSGATKRARSRHGQHSGTRFKKKPKGGHVFVLGRAGTLYDIVHDIPRTFLGRPEFDPEVARRNPGRAAGGGPEAARARLEALERVLCAYCFLRQDVGYMQGMTYLAGHLLLYMDEFSAFVCFSSLLATPFCRALYMSGNIVNDAMESRLAVFNHTFVRHLPRLHKQFTRQNLHVHMYFLQWALTLFTKILPFSACARVWDGFLIEGEVYLYRTGVAIFVLLRNELRNRPIGDIMETLNLHRFHLESVDDLEAAIRRVRVTTTVATEAAKLAEAVDAKGQPTGVIIGRR